MKIVITGGGTGGHVFPALAIAEELRSRGHVVIYVGSDQGMEAKLVPERGFEFHTVKSGAVKNQSFVRIVKTLLALLEGILYARRWLRREKPSAVIGVGGYVSVPVCVAAFLSRIPIYLQEQNVSVGIANRFLGRLARKIFLGFEGAEACFPKSRCVVTGNPIRKEFTRADFPKYDATANCLVVLGGSQGAHSINEVIVNRLEALMERYPGLHIIHQTGRKEFDSVKASYEAKRMPQHEVVPFVSEIATLYAKASFIVARSGALTVSELIAVGRPSLLVPYPRKGQNDQTANAYLLEKHGAARVVEQGDNFEHRFWNTLVETFQPDRLPRMSEGYRGLQKGGALVSIADTLERELSL